MAQLAAVAGDLRVGGMPGLLDPMLQQLLELLFDLGLYQPFELRLGDERSWQSPG